MVNARIILTNTTGGTGRRWDLVSETDGTLYLTDQSGGGNRLRITTGGLVEAIAALYPGTGAAFQEIARLAETLLCLKETTTPGAEAGYGKFYTKADNTPYFQDGDGVEHTLDVDGVGSGGGVGEMLVQDGASAPPVMLTNEAEDDYVYADVA